MQQKTSVTIIGTGPVGCLMAILLAKRGYTVDIYERYSKEKIVEKLSSRSYNITFFSRGINALKKAGLYDSVKQYFIPLTGTVAHPLYSVPTFHKYDTTKSQYVAVKRSSILETFLNEIASYPQVTVHFDTSLLSIDRYKKSFIVQNNKTKKISHIETSLIIGADGVHSEVRKSILEGQHAKFSQEYETWRYKQINVNIGMVEKLNMKKKIMHVWSRKEALIALLPNEDDSYAGMLTLPSFDILDTPENIHAYFAENFPDLMANITHITADLLANPEGRLVSIYTDPWYYEDFITLIGDAAHGALPFLGQGITAGFEDCIALASLIDKQNGDWKTILPLYQEKRKRHGDVVVNQSQKMFSKFLRHTYADYEAIYDRVDFLIHGLFPNHWHPALYMMFSSYSTYGFADILAMHKKQRRLSKMIGLSAIVWTFTQVLSVGEQSMNWFQWVSKKMRASLFIKKTPGLN
ncbi:NAD(P)/FAD-dependent oxidoreductase [soil metagenome]